MRCSHGTPQTLHKNRCVIVSGSFLCVWCFLLSTLLAPLCLAAEEKPVIALVTEKEEGGAFENLLLVELTARETFRLVERDEIWRAHQELSTMAGFKNALQLGARLKAHALLMITGDKEKSVRLVETTRGVILAQWLRDQTGDKPEKPLNFSPTRWSRTNLICWFPPTPGCSYPCAATMRAAPTRPLLCCFLGSIR